MEKYQKCVCYAPAIYDCPANQAPNSLRNEVMNEKRICTAGYGDECQYSGNAISCGDDDVYLIDAVLFCDEGCTPLGATPSPITSAGEEEEEEEDSSVVPDPTEAAGSDPSPEADSAERVSSGAASNQTLAGWFGMVTTAIIVILTVQ